MIGIPAWNAFQVWDQSHRDEIHSADAIVVLGAAEYNGIPSPVFQARLDHALLLFHQGLAPTIFTTGGKEGRDIYTEAEVGEAYLLKQGVPLSRLLTESSGRT
ncbi:MAG: YdcF family protein, partial [Candidatus Dormibacteraceae bacterium]